MDIDLPALREDEPYDFNYRVAVFFLAGNYAAEEVRRQQGYANSRGDSLSKEGIARIFKQSADYMADKINRTSGGQP